MNMKRLRELKDQFVTDNYDVNTSEVIDGAAVDALNKFFNFVKEKEKERRASEFKPDPSPMIGMNPFRKDTMVSDGDHLFIPPINTDRSTETADARFNRLLNYRVGPSAE